MGTSGDTPQRSQHRGAAFGIPTDGVHIDTEGCAKANIKERKGVILIRFRTSPGPDITVLNLEMIMKKDLYPEGTLALILATAKMLTEAGAVARKPAAPGEERQSYTVTVDEQGVMRRSDNGEEVSYYGTNYTVPFAYSYRALGYLGRDRREAIDRDIYHIARLGLNAFRLHLWDAELADSEGNLLDNDHLDLLDYMISRLEGVA